jgi:hypothetical protein
MGEQLRQEGYWGCFGLDFLLDQDSGTMYLGEMNPRITGASPLTNQAAIDRGQPPLLLFHLLEWMGVDFSLDIDEFNQLWLEPGPAANWSQLIIDHIREGSETPAEVPASGVWRIEPDGDLHFVRRAFVPWAAADESEAFFMRTLDAGHPTFKGWCVGRLTARGRLIDDDYRLTARATAWIRGFRRVFDSSPKQS